MVVATILIGIFLRILEKSTQVKEVLSQRLVCLCNILLLVQRRRVVEGAHDASCHVIK
jgi:hypothetical protein